MTDNKHHPYTLEVQPSHKAGHFQWAIRRHGKLVERGDRLEPSEAAARKDGERRIERMFASAGSER